MPFVARSFFFRASLAVSNSYRSKGSKLFLSIYSFYLPAECKQIYQRSKSEHSECKESDNTRAILSHVETVNAANAKQTQ